LQRDAEDATVDAAERWRRLGALVAGVDTATALTAYESAFRLQPRDFWTCVELSRLRQCIGDLRGSEEAAAAAQRVATTDREVLVAYGEIGNVLVAQGDGPGALAAYRRGLAIREVLAARDPANTQFQTDVAVSCAKLGTLDHGQNWEARQRYLLRGKELLLTLQSAGRLMANQDWIEWFNEQLATVETFDNSDGKTRGR